MIQPPFLSTIAAQPCHVIFLTTKSVVRKNQENNSQTGSRAWTGQSLHKGHEATETGLAYAPVSQAHGHNHIVQCFACCTAA